MAKVKTKANTKAKPKPRAPKNAPIMPVKPRKPKSAPTPGQIARSERIARIRARTTAGLRELRQLAQGADISDLAHLKVMIVTGPRRKEVTWRSSTPREPRDPDRDSELRKKFARRRGGQTGQAWHTDRAMLPPPTGRRCKNCRHPEHMTMSCKELVEWMKVSAKVLAGEVETPDGAPAPRVVPVEGLPDPRPVGRPPNTRRLSLQERSKELFKTASAAASCPAPSPSS